MSQAAVPGASSDRHPASPSGEPRDAIGHRVSGSPSTHREVAMTGEVTLRGRVLRIGGLKEKSIAAHRAGIKTIIIPADNERDLVEIPDQVKKDIVFKPVAKVDEVLRLALAA